jgi:hypothetical protein
VNGLKHRFYNNIPEVVGKGLLLLLTFVLIYASYDSGWDIAIVVLMVLVGVLTGLSIYRDFHRIRLFLWKNTKLELLKPDPEVPELTGGFPQYIQITSKKSPSLANNLRLVYENTDGDADPFEELSTTIEHAIEDDYFERTMTDIENALKLKKYVRDDDRAKLRPVNLKDDILIAKADGDGVLPVEGLYFDLYAKITVSSRGESEEFEKVVGVATLFEVSGDMYRLQMNDWDPGAETDLQELKESLLRRRSPRLEVQTRGVEEADWNELEEAYNYLKRLRSAGVDDVQT